MEKPKVCVFCGATPLSKEHVWSEWTYKILPKRQGGSHVRGVIQTTKGSPRIRGLRSIKKHQGDVSAIRIRAVCRSKTRGTNSLGKTGCNDGWMNHQEDAVKQILTPLILGHHAVLGEDEQRILATWIATKLMVAEFSEPGDVVSTQAERSFVMNERRPPATWKIWIACQTAKQWRTGYGRHSLTAGALDETETPVTPDGSFAKNTEMVVLGMGYLLIHVFTSRVPEFFTKVYYPSKVILFRIHPFESAFLWPPARIIGDAGIDYLMRRFDGYTSGLKWRATS